MYLEERGIKEEQFQPKQEPFTYSQHAQLIRNRADSEEGSVMTGRFQKQRKTDNTSP